MADHGHSGHSEHEGDEHANAAPLGPVKHASNYTEGGHEIDYTPNRNLMAFLVVGAVLIILSALGVYQLFVGHTDEQLDAAASAPTSQLVAQQKRDEGLRTSYGKVEWDGKPAGFRVPFDEARRLVLGDNARFAATPPPSAEWVHPDDAGKKK